MDILKQSTNVTIVMGPMLNDADGNTPETTLSIAQADIRVSKNGGVYAQTNNATGATHMEFGRFAVPLDTVDTATLGKVRVDIHKSGALAVWREFTVVPANKYDSLVLGTDVLHADVTQWLGTAAATPTIAGVPEVDITHLAGTAQSVIDLKEFADTGYDPATNKVQGVVLTDTCTTTATATNLTNAPTAGDLTATMKASVNTEADAALSDIHLDHLLAADYDPTAKPGAATALLNELVENDGSGVSRYTVTALEQSPSGGTNPNVLIDTTITVTDQTHFTLTAGSNDDDAYNDQSVVLYDASDSDYPSVRKCNAYAGATKTVTLDSAPDFVIVNGDGAKVFVTAPGTTAPTVGQIRSEMEGVGYFLDLIKADTDELQGDWVNDGRLDLILDIIAADTTTDIPALIADVPTVAEFEARTLVAADYIVVADILDAAIEGAYTLREVLRATAATMCGVSSGAGTNTMVFRDLNNVKDRVTATLTEDGDRSTVVIDVA